MSKTPAAPRVAPTPRGAPAPQGRAGGARLRDDELERRFREAQAQLQNYVSRITTET